VALRDRNILVQRTILDVIVVLFPFHASFLLSEDLVAILTVALETLLKRDASLSRRFYSWLLGPSHSSARPPPVSNSSSSSSASFTTSSYSSLSDSTKRDGEAKMHLPLSEGNSKRVSSYFEQHVKGYLLRALGKVLDNAGSALYRLGQLETPTSDAKAECVLPYRILRALHDHPEVSHLMAESVMLDLVRCFQSQLDLLGGLSSPATWTTAKSESRPQPPPSGPQKKSGKRGSLKAEIVQSANLLLATLGRDFVWQWMEGLVEKQATSLPGKRAESGAVGRSKEEDQLFDDEEEGSVGVGNNGSEYVGLDKIGGMTSERRADVRAMSPISEMLETQLSGRKARRSKVGLESSSTHHSLQDRGRTGYSTGKNHSLTRRPSGQPGLVEILSLVSLLLQVLPKVSSNSILCNSLDL